MRHYLTLVLTILIMGLTVSANADTIFMEPIDDMYTDPNGSQVVDQLWVANFSGAGNFQRTMIRFDLSQLARQTIESAILNLYLFFGCPMHPITHTHFYAITQDWDEDTWPATQHIAHGIDVWSSCDFNANEPGWYNIDITTLVQAWVDESVQDYGLVIIAISGDRFSKFYSKEYTNSNLHPYLEVTYTAGAVDDENFEMPLFLSQNYPNPFSGSTTICFSLHPTNLQTDNATISIYNLKGQLVKSFPLTTHYSPHTNVVWDGTDMNGNKLPSGIYFYHLKSENIISEVKKMVLIR